MNATQIVYDLVMINESVMTDAPSNTLIT